MVTISGLCLHTHKSSEDCEYALAATKKRQVAPERLLQTRSTFTKSAMVSMGVTKLRQMVQNRHDFYRCYRVEINDAYYREVLLTQKLLPVMHKICGEFFIFQQGNVPAHRARGTTNLLKRDTCVYFARPFSTQQHRSEPS